MATEAKEELVVTQTILPFPALKRAIPYSAKGYTTTDNDDWLIYCVDRVVAIYNLKDPRKSLAFEEHKLDACAAALSPNGKHVASADTSGQIHIWSPKTLRVWKSYPGPQEPRDICWSPDSKRLCVVGTGASQKRGVVIMVDSGSAVGGIQGHIKAVMSCDYRPKKPFKIITSSEDHTVILHKGPPFTREKQLNHHKNYVNTVRYSPDGDSFISVSNDKQILIYDAESGEKKGELKDKEKGHKGSIMSFSWSPCGKYILTASLDKSAKIWSVEENTVTKTFQFANTIDNMQQCAVWWQGTDKEHLLSISLNGSINFLNAGSGNIDKTLTGVTAAPTAVAKDPQSKDFYIAMKKGIVANQDGKFCNISGKGHGGTGASALACSMSGELLFSVGPDKKLFITETKSLEYSNSIDLSAFPLSLAAGNKNKTLVAVGLSKLIIVVKDGSIVSKNSVDYDVTALRWNPDDTTLAAGTKKGRRIVSFTFDGTNLKEVAKTADEMARGECKCIKFFGDFMIASTTGEIMIFNKADGKRKKSWGKQTGNVNYIAINPSNTHALGISQDESVCVYPDLKDFWTFNVKHFKNVHSGGGIFCEWLDDKTFMTVGNTGVVKMWELSTS